MIGLPTEEPEDVLAIAELTAQDPRRLCDAERARRRVANITVSVNPFVPKPWTPFQWDPMETIPSLKQKFASCGAPCLRFPTCASMPSRRAKATFRRCCRAATVASGVSAPSMKRTATGGA